MPSDSESGPAKAAVNEDVRRLNEMGYSQELARRLGTFSNFALSFSIICILAGGVTSFHLGLCSVGGASIGLGWPLVVLFALAVGRHNGAARLRVSDGWRPLTTGPHFSVAADGDG